MIPYEGVKLAPSISKIRLLAAERRGNEEYWYTTHITPAAVSVTPTTSSSSTSSTSKDTNQPGITLSFKRKPYTIYRRHVDFVEFRQRLKHLLENRRPRVLLDLPDLTHTDAAILSLLSPSTPRLADEESAKDGKDGKDGKDSKDSKDGKDGEDEWAVQQALEELDNFLKRVLTLPGPLLNEKAVLEFFGIWKSDVDYKLAKNLSDPFALTMAGRTLPSTRSPDPLSPLSPVDASCAAASKESTLNNATSGLLNMMQKIRRPTVTTTATANNELPEIRPSLRRAKTTTLRQKKSPQGEDVASDGDMSGLDEVQHSDSDEDGYRVGVDAIDGFQRLSTAAATLVRRP